MEQFALLKVISADRNDHGLTPGFLMGALKINKRDLNSRMEKLFTLGIVDMVGGVYMITPFGKEILNTLIIIEDAMKICGTKRIISG
jgi:predicted transcriptional regulator